MENPQKRNLVLDMLNFPMTVFVYKNTKNQKNFYEQIKEIIGKCLFYLNLEFVIKNSRLLVQIYIQFDNLIYHTN